MNATYNTPTRRWYACECDRPSCREQFYMKIRDYETATLGAGVRMVVPDHKPPGAKPIRRWQGVVMIGGR